MDTDYDETAAPPTLPRNENLAAYWCRPVSALATLPAGPALLPAEKERHRLYALLTLAITAAFFNGNKFGQEGSYPWREKQKKANGSYNGNDYFGHNIACIAVSGTGEVIDFDFNHNELFNSSAEHAEARLVRRIFNLNQIYDHWETKAYDSIPPAGYGTVLSSVTIYTSLESCAQCSGIMTLGNVKSVVYLQSDPGQYSVGNILFNLTRRLSAKASAGSRYGAPEPIDATRFDLDHKRQLDSAYQEYASKVTDPAQPAFFIPADPSKQPNRSPSVTSFLCTDATLDVFAGAEDELNSFTVAFPNYQPSSADGAPPSALDNATVLEHVRAFLAHVKHHGRRGTPHR